MEHRFPQGHLAARQDDAQNEPHRLGRLGEEIHGAIGDAHDRLALHALLPDHAAGGSVAPGQGRLQGEHPYHGNGAQGLYQERGGSGYLLLRPSLQTLGQGIQVQGQSHVDAAVQHPRHRDVPVPHKQHHKGDRKDYREPDQIHYQKGIEHRHGSLRVAGQAGDIVTDFVPGHGPVWHMEDMAEQELPQPYSALGSGNGLEILAIDHRRHEQQEHRQHPEQGHHDVALAGPGDDVNQLLVDIRHGKQNGQLESPQCQAKEISLPGRAHVGEAPAI